MRLIGKEHLAQARYGNRIDESGQGGQDQRHSKRGYEVFDHKYSDLCQVQQGQNLIDGPDAGKRYDDAANAVDQDVAPQ